jgi:hypothetical protein
MCTICDSFDQTSQSSTFDGRIMGAAEQWPEPATTDVSHSSYADLLPAEFGSAESSGNVL